MNANFHARKKNLSPPPSRLDRFSPLPVREPVQAQHSLVCSCNSTCNSVQLTHPLFLLRSSRSAANHHYSSKYQYHFRLYQQQLSTSFPAVQHCCYTQCVTFSNPSVLF